MTLKILAVGRIAKECLSFYGAVVQVAATIVAATWLNSCRAGQGSYFPTG